MRLLGMRPLLLRVTVQVDDCKGRLQLPHRKVEVCKASSSDSILEQTLATRYDALHVTAEASTKHLLSYIRTLKLGRTYSTYQTETTQQTSEASEFRSRQVDAPTPKKLSKTIARDGHDIAS